MRCPSKDDIDYLHIKLPPLRTNTNVQNVVASLKLALTLVT